MSCENLREVERLFAEPLFTDLFMTKILNLQTNTIKIKVKGEGKVDLASVLTEGIALQMRAPDSLIIL